MFEGLVGPESIDRSEHAEEYVLDDLFGVLNGGDEPVSPPKHHLGVLIDQFPEGRRPVRAFLLYPTYK